MEEVSSVETVWATTVFDNTVACDVYDMKSVALLSLLWSSGEFVVVGLLFG